MFQIVGKEQNFKQWDLEQLVTCDCLKEGDAVVFSGHGKTYETTAFVQDGQAVADVPNFLLQKAGSFRVDLGWGLDCHMDCRTTFTVEAREKPDDYECTYNIKQRKEEANGTGVTSWNDLPDRPFGEGELKWAKVLDGKISTTNLTANGSYTAIIQYPFTPIVNRTYRIEVKDAMWNFVVATNDCVCTVEQPVLGYLKYSLGLSGGTVLAYCTVASGASPQNWVFEFQNAVGTSGWKVAVYEGTPTVIPLDEKYIPDTIQRVGEDIILNSSTTDSTKKFKLTVDDSGTITATEV